MQLLLRARPHSHQGRQRGIFRGDESGGGEAPLSRVLTQGLIKTAAHEGGGNKEAQERTTDRQRESQREGEWERERARD